MEKLLLKQEGKTLEFKENTSSLSSIIKTIVAFANTSGGTIVVGIEDKTKKVVGLDDALEDEMRVINKIAYTITPSLRPNIEIQAFRNKNIILIHVPYSVGPYYLKKTPTELVAYVRFGSTNRIASDDDIATMKSLSKNTTFDELPCPQASVDDLDWDNLESTLSTVKQPITRNKIKSIGILTTASGTEMLSNGGILLFGKNRDDIFPDAIIRCVRFDGITKEASLDHLEINTYLTKAIDEVLYFIRKNTFTKSKIGTKQRIETPQYPTEAVREALINALVHTDYAIKGASIIIAIFDDRIEITNPGALPHGISLEDALAGSSRVRNRVIAKTFHILKLIEQWGSGFNKIIQACIKAGLQEPKFEEFGSQFRVTLYSKPVKKAVHEKWQKNFLSHLKTKKTISTQEAAHFWRIDTRSARRRLNKLLQDGVILRQGTSKNDPHGKYMASKK